MLQPIIIAVFAGLASPFALLPSAATTLIAFIPFARSAANTASRVAASIAAACRAPSLVLYA